METSCHGEPSFIRYCVVPANRDKLLRVSLFAVSAGARPQTMTSKRNFPSMTVSLIDVRSRSALARTHRPMAIPVLAAAIRFAC
jgi:hypothetical protein